MAKEKLLTASITLPGGKRKYFRAKTKAELSAKVDAAKYAIGQGINIDDSTTLTELAQLWFDTVKKPVIRATTANTLKSNLNLYVLQPFIAGMKVKDIKPTHIALAMANLSKYSHGIQSHALSLYKALFRFAMENRLILYTPILSDTKPGGPQTRERVPLTREQSQQLLAADLTPGAHLFCAIALGAGLRREEILGLMWEDVDLESGVIHVRHANPLNPGTTGITTELKTPAAKRDIPMPIWLLAEMKKARAASTSLYVLASDTGAPYDAKEFSRMDYSIQRQNFAFHVYPHLLRHTCITRWFEAGLDIKEIQYLAGHSTLEMTLSVYTHYDRAGRADETARKIREAAAF